MCWKMCYVTIIIILLFPVPTVFSPADGPDEIPEDIQELLQKAKDEYHINPTTKQEFDNMLAYADNTVQNLSVDGIKVATQRFEEIRSKYSDKAIDLRQKNILRQWVDNPKQRNARARAFALMTQFLYAAQYKLSYGQALRAVYHNNTDYKIGYVFAQMRTIKNSQLILYSSMDFNLRRHFEWVLDKNKDKKRPTAYADFETYLQLYEAIRRKDVDMLDMIYLARVLEKERKAAPTTEAKVASNETTDSNTESDYLG